MNTATQKGSLFGALNSLADEIQTTKTAGAKGVTTKKADNPVPADPGGYNGQSSHPSAHVDNRGQAASEGSRSSENESDNKSDQPIGVDNTSELPADSQDDVQLNIGMHQSATGEDASVEDAYKGGKDDPGSTSPARTDNDSLDGMKYASMSLGNAYDLHSTLANGILADLANGQGTQLTKQALATAAGTTEGTLAPAATGDNPTKPAQTQINGKPPIQKTAGAAPAAASAPVNDIDAMIKKAAAAVKAGQGVAGSPAANNPDLAAGYELATLLGVEKQAAQAGVANMIETTILDGQKDAELFGTYYNAFLKRAGDDGGSEDHNKKGDPGSGANDAAGAGGSGGSEPGGGDGGGGGGGGQSLGDMLGGGSDPGGLAGGGAPGGAPGGGAPGGGQPSQEQVLMELASALEELGIPLDRLAQMGSGGAGGAGGAPGGAPPSGDPLAGAGGGDPLAMMAGGGAPPGGGDPMAGGGTPPMGEGMKLASAVVNFKRSGKFAFKAANAGSPERKLRDNIKSYILEMSR